MERFSLNRYRFIFPSCIQSKSLVFVLSVQFNVIYTHVAENRVSGAEKDERPFWFTIHRQLVFYILPLSRQPSVFDEDLTHSVAHMFRPISGTKSAFNLVLSFNNLSWKMRVRTHNEGRQLAVESWYGRLILITIRHDIGDFHRYKAFFTSDSRQSVRNSANIFLILSISPIHRFDSPTKEGGVQWKVD